MTEVAQQYREVKRKAAVGERIKIVDGGVRFSSGSVYVVEDADFPWGGDDRDGTGVAIDGGKPLFHRRYVVLEPVAQLIAELAPTSPLTSDPLYASFRQFVADNAPALRKLLDEVDPEPTVVTAPVITKLTRAQVIAKASADVAELERIYWSLDVKFRVNREHRVVICDVRRDGKMFGRGRAKASPNDVFHAEIGKAIALRKALGLTVPSEYTDAPQPDEPRVGAVVLYASLRKGPVRTTLTERVPSCDNNGYGKYAFNHTYMGGWIADKQYEIIDDTDVDYGAKTQANAA